LSHLDPLKVCFLKDHISAQGVLPRQICARVWPRFVNAHEHRGLESPTIFWQWKFKNWPKISVSAPITLAARQV